MATKLPVSFYVLSDHKAQDLLGFICQLTQTALNKSGQSILILIEDNELLDKLDQALWDNDALSFVPHELLTGSSVPVAPVALGSYMPAGFDGIVLNTTIRPVNEFMTSTSNARFTRVLEIIRPDSNSVQEGRAKYKYYQQLNYELTHFKV